VIIIETNAVKHDDLCKPTPEMLAAYVDGELEPCQRDAVEAWLARHPEACADVLAQRQLVKLYESTRPPEPDADTWSVALAGIQAQVPWGPRVERKRRLSLRRLVALVAAAAAAAIIAALLLRPAPPGPDSTETDVAEPWPVVSDGDVIITRIAEADRESVVVGDLPISAPLLLADHGDINQVELTPDQGMNPQYHPDRAPMVISEPRKDAGSEDKAP
jgi:anti-sigma factor RsiW